MAKAYNLSFDYVLYGMSYANLILYGSVLPSYHTKDEKDKIKKNGVHIDVRKRGALRDNENKVRQFIDACI